jgi:oxygen-independent coproporphyrinogen-3 oxidase
MAADGLLTIGADFIELRPLGRLMLRNVCMVFDRYLQSRPQQFSRTV